MDCYQYVILIYYLIKMEIMCVFVIKTISPPMSQFLQLFALYSQRLLNNHYLI